MPIPPNDNNILPDHESAVRRLVADAHGRPYYPLHSLEEARLYPDGAAIFEGDWGGQIYATIPTDLIRCNVAAIERLLRDLDALGWCDLAGARIYYERRPVGAGVAGGMGGGRIIQGVWIHERIVHLGVGQAIQDLLEGRRDPEDSVYYAIPAWDDTTVEGFTFGSIKNWSGDFGNAFVAAPDGSRAGIRWHALRRPEDLKPNLSAKDVRYYTQPDYFEERRAPESHLWGIWSVAFPHPMRADDPVGIREDARRNLAAVLPALRERWTTWRTKSGIPTAE